MTNDHKQEIGTQHKLKQSLKTRHVTMIALGGIIGAGLFVGSGAVINATGPAAVLSYILAGGLMVLIMRMIGEMAVAEPSTGSISDYARKALGNWAGFTVGWLYWYMWIIVLAIEAVAGAGILVNYLNIPSWLLCLSLIVLLTLTNLYSVGSYGEAEFWFASIKIVAIIAFIAVGVLFLIGLWPGDSPGLSMIYSDGGFFPKGVGAALIGTVTVLFSIGGAEIATIAAAESDNPEKNAAKATNQVMYRVFFFYVVSVFLIVCIVPWNIDFAGVAIKSPFAMALNELGIPVAAAIMKIVILTAVLSSLNSCLYITSRMLFALTRHGDAPPIFLKTTKRGVPVWAILAGTTFGYVAVILNYFFPETVFLFLINSAGAISLFYYLIIAYSEIKLRRKLEQEAPEKLKLKMWLFPYLTYFTIFCMLAVLIAMLWLPDTRPEILMSFVSLVIILVAYKFRANNQYTDGSYAKTDEPVGKSPFN
ncbi:GABA permease [Scopulibacillus darangshiensis]|uniref:GABA permease n=1 Tax=Scopulibacillus darangshiensis TaxID=442528 RepID=A0A4R2P5P5_9BACL|nr:amino acid permease [Scopulibacillus darangshiensis]TCP29444.1 GABA permease [Scopulibacillus darangshiensis]